MRLFDSDTSIPPAVAGSATSEPAASVDGQPTRAASAIVEADPGALNRTLVTLAGRQLLAPDGTPLAELDGEEVWRTPAGLRCEALTIPAARASAYVDPEEVTRGAREADRIWREAAVEKIAWLAEHKAEITSDDLWEHMEHPPRESRLVGHAFKRAGSQGLITSTGRHQRSRRGMNHTRPVLIWRSLHPAHT
jgi:hypothetical protein